MKFGYKIKGNFNDQIPSTQQDPPSAPIKLTKRKILSKLAGIFDPIGAAAAVLVTPKIAMQRLWQLGLGWDEEVPSSEMAATVSRRGQPKQSKN